MEAILAEDDRLDIVLPSQLYAVNRPQVARGTLQTATARPAAGPL